MHIANNSEESNIEGEKTEAKASLDRSPNHEIHSYKKLLLLAKLDTQGTPAS